MANSQQAYSIDNQDGVTNDSTNAESGIIGDGLAFDRSYEYGSVSNDINLSNTNWTITCWINQELWTANIQANIISMQDGFPITNKSLTHSSSF